MKGQDTLHNECPNCGNREYQAISIKGYWMLCECERCKCTYNCKESRHKGFSTFRSTLESPPTYGRCPMCAKYRHKAELMGNGGICDKCESTKL